MHYVIHCLDRENSVQKRLDHYDDHKRYLSEGHIKTLISGPLLADDEETMIGSCFVVEADKLEDVVAFNRNDPFYAADLWETISIRPFSKRVDNRP